MFPPSPTNHTSKKWRVAVLSLLLASLTLVIISTDEAPFKWNAVLDPTQRVELFDWVTDGDPAVHGHPDHIVGADADDPNFKLSQFEIDSPNERMIPGAKETRCPMCKGTADYYDLEGRLRNGQLEAGTQASREQRGRVAPVVNIKSAKMLNVDSPSTALQVLLNKVIRDIRKEGESYAKVDDARRKAAAEARLLEKQRTGLRQEEADVEAELERISNEQGNLVHLLPVSENGDYRAPP
mmetsp:Transcript_22680/g.45838  ORF Transcript_22680/g.45838 Transcript_22680/m.45838 type:complete len:239 (+) Transcript_22680:235-951(+)|eukprot:CAMPEP_0181331530 /NCGR_PEP_ID=MMETSP1101-20121128/24551_1 /TAXON_ID=46948 /ORGANISM="Rhodomonas abbreviata, Strain Caron Lab Isolate" /LENGTH=238 /DNA_ID=CAMNT_0023440997 /DNA_START=230 /DNA_END=946 /DNA_ORIENTATION=-